VSNAVSRYSPRSWALWRLPRVLVRYFLAVEITVAGLTIYLAAFHTHAYRDHWWQLGVLIVLALLQAEASRKIERTRRLIANAPHVNMTSVWVFAGVILLPPALGGLLVIVVYAHLWARIWRTMGTRPVHRVLFSTAMMMVSAYVAAGTIAVGQLVLRANGWSGSAYWAVLVIAASLMFLVVNSVMVAVAAALHGRPRHLMISWADYALEIATLYLGAFVSLALLTTPVAVVLVMPPLLVLHRAVLVKQLEELAIIDHKTGLLNVSAWHEQARRELVRAERENATFGVLMIDLDHFKRVNDTYGHLAGDEVLRGVARMLESEIREYDSAGRFGGEEFAVLIPDSSAADVVSIAERLRRKVTELEIIAPTDAGQRSIFGLSASIGVAVFPSSGSTLEQLLLTADSAVYTAKSNGRDQVVALSP
jgi:diguanylate cyclase (GGDEF)-like protein